MQLLERADQDEETVGMDVERMAESAPTSTGDPVAVIAAGSVLLAWYQFYVKGDRESGIFIGLWAPTMMAAATYVQQKGAITKLKRGLASF